MRSESFWAWFDAEARPKLAVRAETFARAFEYLDTREGPITILETGCIRNPGDWEGDGQSTILFDRYARHRGDVKFASVDSDHRSVCIAIDHTDSDFTRIFCNDSIHFLARTPPNPPLDLLYLDSFDFEMDDPIPSALHHLKELYAALPLIGPDTLVMVDDSPISLDGTPSGTMRITGKGRLVAEYAAEYGATLQFAHYQVGWTGMHKRTNGADPVERLVERAKEHAEADRTLNADALFKMVLQQTYPMETNADRHARAAACVWFARNAVLKGLLGTAADWYRQALVADPLGVSTRLERITEALLPNSAYREAFAEAERATRIAPKYSETWRALGRVEYERDREGPAVAAYQRQLELAPDDPSAALDRAIIACEVEDFATASELVVEKVLGTDREPDGWVALATAAYRVGDFHKAIELFGRAERSGFRDTALLQWNKSLSLFALGRLKEGWIAHEARKDVKDQPALSGAPNRFTLPMWKGEPPPARIHVHHESGMGDNLWAARFFPRLVDAGYDVRYECHDDLVSLMRRSFPKVQVIRVAVDWPGAFGMPPFDYHMPVGSLAPVFGVDLDTPTWPGPYLVPDPEKVEHYRKLVPPGSIGLCWSAGIRPGIAVNRFGRHKSMPAREMTRVALAMPHPRNWVSLQVGPERAEIMDDGYTRGGLGWVRDLLPARPTWDDTAALIACLDAVVTVDTGVAHVAGAMGKPVFLAMHCAGGSWHWLTGHAGKRYETESPWYPSVRIYRQRKVDEWGDVIERIAADLAVRDG
jgi:Glycosyltransferase family 9 (heptosyltransferase)